MAARIAQQCERCGCSPGDSPIFLRRAQEHATNTCLNFEPNVPHLSALAACCRLEHGYPTPSVGRDVILKQALPWLREQNIWSRGRFGAYKYEVANQDHSLMLGVECADNILFGTMELTLNHPTIVNTNKNSELLYSCLGSVSR
jgi:hypothetical protein